MDKVRFGIVGLGNMGKHHANYMKSVEGAELTALCDGDPKVLENVGGKYEVKRFARYDDMIGSGLIDAVLIATPHYSHPDMTSAAFAKGIHVLVEKPVAVHVKEARRMNEAARKYPQLKFGIMYQMRTQPLYQKVRELVTDGELGQITRITWVITDWFRTWHYYASGGWRATWAGEGGGVLLNQCPHQLDLLQWCVGGMMPSRVTAVAFIAKAHPIEVEDEVSAILEYPNGAIGHFITTTGEAPGTDRLQIVGDRGALIAENGKLLFRRTRKSVTEVLRTSQKSFDNIECWDIDIPVGPRRNDSHKAITQNFVNTILKNEAMLAPAEEGIRGLEIGNAMLMAGLTRKPVELPVDGEAFEQFLKQLTTDYGGKKTLRAPEKDDAADMAASFRGQ